MSSGDVWTREPVEEQHRQVLRSVIRRVACFVGGHRAGCMQVLVEVVGNVLHKVIILCIICFTYFNN